MSTPYISLGMMLGDAHVDVLGRCLSSVINRYHNGKLTQPLVDEIVLGWNGNNSPALSRELFKLGYRPAIGGMGDIEAGLWPFQPGDKCFWPEELKGEGLPPLRVVPFEWPGRFDTARNAYWKHCKGEWLLWLDADDIVADAGTPKGLAAIERVEKDYGLPPMPPSLDLPVTLKAWLSSLPPRINVIFSPYDYTHDEHNYVQVRQKMKRIVRRSAGHIWHSPEESGVHELLTCIGGVAEVMAETFGLLVQHFPSQDEIVRVTRNRQIVEQLTKPGILSDPRHAYDVANAALSAGNLVQANEAISSAIVHAHNDMDRYTYRLARAFIGMVEGNPEKMLQEAFAAIGLMPELRDAYFIACDAYYRLAKWLAVIEWFERGVAKTPTLLSRDQPLAAFTAPRAQAALAYTYIGLTEKGIKLIEEMEKEYPKAGMTIEAGAKVRALARQQNGETSLFAGLDYLSSVSPSSAKMMVDALRNTHALDVLRSTVPWAAAERRIIDAAQHGSMLVVEGENPVNGKTSIRFADNGIINLDDALERLAYPKTNSQLVSAEQAPDRRSLNAVIRSRAAEGRKAGARSGTDALGQMTISLGAKRIAFYAPIGITRWEPAEYDSLGMGGSESSVALLARELSLRGYEVTVFTNKPTVPITSLWSGVIQKDCTQYRPHEWGKGTTVVFCRAPWMVREDPPMGADVWCWHQDNGYANPWMWNPELVSKQHHFFVSEFARISLLKDAGLTSDVFLSKTNKHCVLGNGILPSFHNEVPKSPRTPKSVVYASNPSRGLAKLLRAWPHVLTQEPDAQLRVACEWNVMLNTSQEEPGFTVREKLQALQEALFKSPNTINLGWLQQEKIRELLQTSHIYAYPGGPMPEGFGVVLVQAQAAGCQVVCPREGALPEVLDVPSTFWLKDQPEPEDIAGLIVTAMRAKPFFPDLSHHHWNNVTTRFVAALEAP